MDTIQGRYDVGGGAYYLKSFDFQKSTENTEHFVKLQKILCKFFHSFEISNNLEQLSEIPLLVFSLTNERSINCRVH